MDSSDIIKARLMDERDLDRTLDRMARQIVETFAIDNLSGAHVGLIGMQRRGVFIARRLQAKIREVEQVDIRGK